MHTRSLRKHEVVLDLIDLESLSLIIESFQSEGIQHFIVSWVHQTIDDYGETVHCVQIQIKSLCDCQRSGLTIPAKQGRALTRLNCHCRVRSGLSDLERPSQHERSSIADWVNWLKLNSINSLYSMISLNVVYRVCGNISWYLHLHRDTGGRG
jgi:hypothetical protein